MIPSPNTSTPRLGTLRVLSAGLIATVGTLAGCECDDTGADPTPVASLAFLAPTDGATLTPADDLRNTLEGIQPAIRLDVRSFTQGTLQLAARADAGSSTPDETATLEVDGAGVYTFNSGSGPTFTIPVGEAVELRAELLDASGELVLSSSVTVTVEGDEEPPQPEITIRRPADGATLRAADDLDADTDGYQLNVEVRLAEVEEGDTLRLSFNGEQVAELESDGDTSATFEAATAEFEPGEELEIEVEVEADGEVVARDRATVTFEEEQEPSCALDLSPVPDPGLCTFSGGSDEDPETPGVQVTFTATGDCDTAQLRLNGDALPEADVVNGSATFTVSLEEGDNTLRLSGAVEGFDFEGDTLTYNVDTLAPALTFTSLAADQEVGPTDDADGDLTNGIQLAAVLVQAEGLDEGENVTLEIGGEQVGTAPVDAAGVATFADVTFGLAGEQTLTARAEDACDNSGDASLTVSVSLGDPDACAVVLDPLPLEDACDSNAASEDADPVADGFQVAFTLTTGCELAALEVNDVAFPVTPQDGVATLIATLNEGDNTLRLSGSRGGFSFTGEPLTWTVDTAAPSADVEGLTEGQTLGRADDVNGDISDGIQYQDIVIVTQGLDEGASIRVTLNGEEVAAGAPDDQGRVALGEVTFASEGEATLVVEVEDACGNPSMITRSAQISFADSAPTVEITSPADGVSLGAEDPANATTPGFQTLVSASCSEVGAAVTLQDGTGATLAQGTCGADNLALLPVTLGRGATTFIAIIEGASGMTGTSAPVTISVDFEGCGLVRVQPMNDQLVVLDDNDGDPSNGVALDFSAVVTDIGGCAGQTVSLSDMGGERATATVAADGTVTFSGVAFPDGATYEVNLQVADPDGESNTVGPITLVVDITAPTLTIDDPAGDAVVLGPMDDLAPAAPGLTTCIVVSTSGADGGLLAVTSSLGAAPIAMGIDATGASQQLCDLVFPEGAQTVTVSLTDTVGRVIEDTFALDVDLTPPGIPTLTAEVQNRRSGQTTLSWTGAGDDGGMGTVTSWEIWRFPRDSQGMPGLTAGVRIDTIPATVDASGTEVYTVDRLPWTYLAANSFSARWFLAVRGVDDVGQRAANYAFVEASTELKETRILGDTTGNQFGITITGVGDVNNDGFDDVVFGDYTSDQLFLFFGREDLASLQDQTPADLVPLTLAEGGNFGISVAPLGDVNGDGIDDFAVGAAPFAAQPGRVYVYLGVDQLGFTGAPAAKITGPAVAGLGLFGYYIAGGGNITDRAGEGLNDILIGAPGTAGQSVVVVTGRTTWSDLTVATGIGSDLTNTANGVVRITSSLPGTAGFGWTVGVLDDLTGDGFSEFVVGAPDTLGPGGPGRSLVFEGGNILGLALTSGDGVTLTPAGNNAQCATAMAVRDVDGDDLRDVVVSCPTGDDGDRIATYLMTGVTDNQAPSNTFRYPVGVRYADYIDLADIDDDGLPDLLVGITPTMAVPGRFYAHFNTGTTFNTRSNTASSFEFIAITNRGADYGEEVSSLGDVNGDGFEDFAVGQLNLERVYFVY